MRCQQGNETVCERVFNNKQALAVFDACFDVHSAVVAAEEDLILVFLFKRGHNVERIRSLSVVRYFQCLGLLRNIELYLVLCREREQNFRIVRALKLR